jgi:hypothetical protein
MIIFDQNVKRVAYKPSYSSGPISVRCPDCHMEANFLFAKTRRVTRNEFATETLKPLEIYFAFEPNPINYSRGHNLHVATFICLDKQDPAAAAQAEIPQRYICKLGTLACKSCDLRRKHELDLSRDAYFHSEYRGKAIWFQNREFLASFIAICEAKQVRGKPFSFWYNNVVPSVFKTAAAKKSLRRKLSGAFFSS